MDSKSIKEAFQEAEEKLTTDIASSIKQFIETTGLAPEINIEYINASTQERDALIPQVTLDRFVYRARGMIIESLQNK